MNIRKFYITGEGIGGGNATPGKAIYLDEFIYEEGTPIGKCYQCDLPNPFTNNQVLTEGVDYVKHYEHWCNNKSTLNGIDTKLFDTTLEQYNKDYKCPDCYLKVIALPLQAEKLEGEKTAADVKYKWSKIFAAKRYGVTGFHIQLDQMEQQELLDDILSIKK